MEKRRHDSYIGPSPGNMISSMSDLTMHWTAQGCI